jgi:hypothetical protein
MVLVEVNGYYIDAEPITNISTPRFTKQDPPQPTPRPHQIKTVQPELKQKTGLDNISKQRQWQEYHSKT